MAVVGSPLSWTSSASGIQPARQRHGGRSTPDMPDSQAHAFLERLNPDTPWLTEIEFLEACVAHLSLFVDEVKKVTFSGASLHRLIINVKIQWLFNDTRHRHSLRSSTSTNAVAKRYHVQ